MAAAAGVAQKNRMYRRLWSYPTAALLAVASAAALSTASADSPAASGTPQGAAPPSMYSVDIKVHGSGKYFVAHLVQNLAERTGFRCTYSTGAPHDIFPQPVLSCRLADIGMAFITVGAVGNRLVNINTYFNPPELEEPVRQVITEVLIDLSADKDVDGVIRHRGRLD